MGFIVFTALTIFNIGKAKTTISEMIKISEDITMTENVHTYRDTIDVIVNRVEYTSRHYTYLLSCHILMQLNPV
jgi:hypothetical protein